MIANALLPKFRTSCKNCKQKKGGTLPSLESFEDQISKRESRLYLSPFPP